MTLDRLTVFGLVVGLLLAISSGLFFGKSEGDVIATPRSVWQTNLWKNVLGNMAIYAVMYLVGLTITMAALENLNVHQDGRLRVFSIIVVVWENVAVLTTIVWSYVVRFGFIKLMTNVVADPKIFVSVILVLITASLFVLAVDHLAEGLEGFT